MTFPKLPLLLAITMTATLLSAQGLDPSTIFKPLGATDNWPTYGGDYTGQRYSALKQIDRANVKNLSLAWSSRLITGTENRRPGTVLVTGGIGKMEATANANIKGSILQVNGVLYISAPDNAWAVDARDGHELWHYVWKTRGGTHIGNRGVGMWRNALFFVTPDDYLISLDARTGKERWHEEIAPFSQQYFLTMAPVVIGDHVLVGTGDDLDTPGYLMSFEPESGKEQWRFYVVPMKPGDPGLETW